LVLLRTEMNPLVSVVIIFWNAERFLRQAVDSVLCQTYPHWELLLVDDGSTDGSAALAQSFASATPGQIRYLTHPGRVNRGMSASRNLGFQHAAGHFIALLDADDQWVLDKLEHQVPILLGYPEAAMLYAPAQYWHPDDPSQDFIQDIGFLEQTVCAPPTLARQFLRDSAGTPATGGLLLRADHVRRLGGFVEQFRSMYEDQAFCFKLALQTTIIASPEPWGRYRQHADSCCSVAFANGLHAGARRRFLDWCATYVREQRVDDSALRAILVRERRTVGRRRTAIAAAGRAVRHFIPPSVRLWLRERRR